MTPRGKGSCVSSRPVPSSSELPNENKTKSQVIDTLRDRSGRGPLSGQFAFPLTVAGGAGGFYTAHKWMI